MVWGRHGFDFVHINGWEGTTSPDDFYASLPPLFLERTIYHQQWIFSTPKKAPFLPTVIRETTKKEDYVLFKLDIDNGEVEKGTIDHLLADHNDDIEYIDQ